MTETTIEAQDRQYKKMTETPVEKLVATLAVPTVLSMLVTNIYNLVDTAFVGTLGNSASGAVGVVFGFMSILQAVAFLCGQGAGSVMSAVWDIRTRRWPRAILPQDFLCRSFWVRSSA